MKDKTKAKNTVKIDRLKKLIDRKTREEIAAGIGCDTSLVTKHYNEDRTVTLEHLAKYCAFFHVSADYLLGLTDTPATDPAAESKFEKGVFDAAIRRHGEPRQTDMMIEEMSELTKAILKFRRSASDETVDAILEEMADVEIMLDQMKMIFGSCAVHRRLKVRRLANRLGLSQMLTNDTKGEVES